MIIIYSDNVVSVSQSELVVPLYWYAARVGLIGFWWLRDKHTDANTRFVLWIGNTFWVRKYFKRFVLLYRYLL